MQVNYSLFPKRPKKQDPFLYSNIINFTTNFYEVNLDTSQRMIYQYEIDLPEYIPSDSCLYEEFLHTFREELIHDIGYVTHKGRFIWGKKENDNLTYKYPIENDSIFLKNLQEEIIKQNLKQEEQEEQLEKTNDHKNNGDQGKKIRTGFKLHKMEEQQNFIKVLVFQRSKHNLMDLNDKDSLPQLLQILNISLKSVLADIGMKQFGKTATYFHNEEGTQSFNQLKIMTGYKFTLVPINKEIRLQIDICSRVLQQKNLREFLHQGKNNHSFEGKMIIARYGRYRTYIIKEIDYSKSPKTTFLHEKEGEFKSYIQYYQEMYGIQILDNTQPLIRVEQKQREIIKGQSHLQIKSIYLIPELVTFVGLTQGQRKSREMREISNRTKFKPLQRVMKCTQIIDTLNHNLTNIQIGNSITVHGISLDKPRIRYLRTECNIKALFVYALSRDKSDKSDAKQTMKKLRKSDINFNFTQFPIKSRKVEQWINQIDDEVNKKRPDIIIFLLNTNEDDGFYGGLKKYFIEKLNIQSQCIKKRTIFPDSNRSTSAAMKICEQINVKNGVIPWEVNLKHQYFKRETIMYGGLSLSKVSNSWILSFVGSISKNYSHDAYSEFITKIKEKQQIQFSEIKSIFISWGDRYFENNKKPPSTILLYRQGLSVPQAEQQITKTQIPAIQALCSHMKQKYGVNSYYPEIIIILVNRHINTRIFDRNKIDQNENDFVNPPEGTVIFQGIVNQNCYDFYLIPQLTREGTSAPTLFKVVYGRSKMPIEALIEFSYAQCYSYYNWKGAIRVPACLQYANKLSKLVGQGQLQQKLEGDLNKSFYFL